MADCELAPHPGCAECERIARDLEKARQNINRAMADLDEAETWSMDLQDAKAAHHEAEHSELSDLFLWREAEKAGQLRIPGTRAA